MEELKVNLFTQPDLVNYLEQKLRTQLTSQRRGSLAQKNHTWDNGHLLPNTPTSSLRIIAVFGKALNVIPTSFF